MLNLFPYTNLHNLNLDWIIRKMKSAVYSVNGYIPDDAGNVEIPTVPTVSSVNGQQGVVVLDAADVGAIPDTVTVPTLTSQLVNDSGYITAAQVGAVTSVNGQTGDVVLDADDVGAVPASGLVDLVYPVGSIYMSINSADPSTLFGGSWERIQDTFLLAAGTTYAAGSTGGEATHTLSINEMPDHEHVNLYVGNVEVGWKNNYMGTGNGATLGTYVATDSTHIKTGNSGGSLAHNNMPPYLAVYVWKRVI